jgi:hypothetical protein
MGIANARRSAANHAAFPSDAEIGGALRQSGMGALAVWSAMSQLLRPVRFDFFGRRRRRLYNLAVVRMGMVQLKEVLVGIITRHHEQTHHPVSLDDLWQGNYKEMLVDFGPGTIDRAIAELQREGIVQRDRRGIADLLRPTGKKYHQGPLAALRRVLDAMKLDLNVRYATEYDTERTYRM